MANGWFVCLVAVAARQPTEFVIVRIRRTRSEGHGAAGAAAGAMAGLGALLVDRTVPAPRDRALVRPGRMGHAAVERTWGVRQMRRRNVMVDGPSMSERRWSSRRTKAAGLGAVVGLAGAALLIPAIASGSARNTVGSGAALQAVQRPFLASLSGAAEVPAGDPDGTGAAAVTIDPTTGEICADLRVANIATPTAAHIHRGAPGVAGPVVVPLTAPNPTSATCFMAAPALAAEIAATPGGFYVNVHNAEYAPGAVRGQLSAGTTTSGSIQMLPEPLRAYDSRLSSDGMITPGTTRTISLGTGTTGAGATQIAVPPGATGAMVRLTVTDTVGGGFLKMYSAALMNAPATAAANWSEPGSILGSDSMVGVDPEGRVKVTAGFGSTHFVIDVVGYVF